MNLETNHLHEKMHSSRFLLNLCFYVWKLDAAIEKTKDDNEMRLNSKQIRVLKMLFQITPWALL